MHRIRLLYLLNAALLAAHEIDSAFWREWELFRLPGGIGLFVVLNLGVMLLVLHGLAMVALQRPSWTGYSWMLVAFGISAGAIHSYFFVMGYPQFRTGISLAVIYGLALGSVLQAIAMLRLAPEQPNR